jgi:GTP-binding protein
VPEIALAGRSNVGKSTLVNALLGAKLAHVAAAPGKTRSVNFYAVEFSSGEGRVARFRLVDLPGYGYARRSKSERKEWSQLTSSYVEKRGSLILVCHLVDLRHGLLANDRLLQDWLGERGSPVMVFFTKADKIAGSKRRAAVQSYVRQGLRSVGVPIATSGEGGLGIQEARAFMEEYVLEREEGFGRETRAER